MASHDLKVFCSALGFFTSLSSKTCPQELTICVVGDDCLWDETGDWFTLCSLNLTYDNSKMARGNG